MDYKTNIGIIALIIGITVIFVLTSCNRKTPEQRAAQEIVEAMARAAGFSSVKEYEAHIAAGESDYTFFNGFITIYHGTETSVVIPGEIRGIPVTGVTFGAFRQKQLTNITIPDSVTSIGAWSFQHNQLSSVVIPNSVNTIAGGAFSDNPLISITIGESVELGSENVAEGAGEGEIIYAFSEDFDNAYNNSGKQAGTYTLNNGVWTLPNGQQYTSPPSGYAVTQADFEIYGTAITKYTGTSTTVSIPWYIQDQIIEEIQYRAFEGKQLTEVEIPNTITIILERAFANNRLANITIPESVIVISPEAFKDNRLTSITIGANVQLAWIMGYGDYGMPAFDNAFDEAYNSHGKQAGTYTLKNGVWELEKWRYFDLYFPSEDGFIAMRAFTYEATAEDIVKQLAENECLPEGCALLGFSIEGKRAYADMNAVYGNALRSTGTMGESMLIGSLVNTLIKFFDLEEIILTAEGQIIETGHVILDFPIKFRDSY